MLDISKINYMASKRKKVNELLTCNQVMSQYGIVLSEDDANELLRVQQDTLKDVGMIEFDNDIVEKLLLTFCDSMFITKYDYLEILSQLVEIFYYYRSDIDIISDDDLIKYLYLAFEGPCQGSLYSLGEYQLNQLLEDLGNGVDIFGGFDDVSKNK